MNAMPDPPVSFRPRLKVADFLMLAESGALAGATKSELLDGDIVCMNAQFRRHSFAKNELTFRLRIALRENGSGLTAMAEASVALSPFDMPEPDIVVTTEPLGAGAVRAATVALLVEVADTTLDRDLGYKAALYAAAAVPEYWVVDLAARRIHRRWQPTSDGYAATDQVAFGETIAAVTIANLRIATDAID
ncbi:MAG: Uma2 family endonuclease [Sphingomonadaceae bacterium]|nr:Uma2 family endonuclease [Sphingomonadaceae bacterium]